jgi:hypothetical protein
LDGYQNYLYKIYSFEDGVCLEIVDIEKKQINFTIFSILNINKDVFMVDPGNNLNSALNVGNLSILKTFTDFVGTLDPIDVYRFNLTQTSNFSLNLNGLAADADVYLVADLDQDGVWDNGESIYSSTRSNSSNETINATLGAGSYFAWIKTNYTSYNTNYNLSLSATATPPTTTSNPGNNLNSALNVGNLSSLKTFKDFVGTVDRTDVYRFNLTYGSLIFRVGHQIVAQGEYKSRLGSSLTSKSFAVRD